MKLNQHQRKALGWIVQEAVEKFIEQRAGLLPPREADDIEDDIEAVLPLLDGDEAHVISVLLRGGFAQGAVEDFRIAA